MGRSTGVADFLTGGDPRVIYSWRKPAVLSTVAVAAGAVTLAALAAPPATAAPTADTQSVIVVLKDQLTRTPADRAHVSARRAAALARQDAVLARLHQQGGRAATSVHHYTVGDAVSLTVTPTQAQSLAADPSVAAVIPNTKIALTPKQAAEVSGLTPHAATVGEPSSTEVCPTDPSHPLLEPEALEDTNTASDDPTVKTAQQLSDGSGVKVAYLADAINPDNPDFIRANGDHVIIDYKAFAANGPTPDQGGVEAYGDASSIAAQGLVSHDLSTFVNPAYPLPAGCNIRILGMAPGASIVALKIDFYTTSIIQAIDYAVSTDHVDVVNESFGGAPIPDASARSAISVFNDAAVAAGVTVTVSTGDAGTTSTIGNPATDPKVISVAANTNSRAYAQTGYAGARAFSNGKWVNDEISSLSSGGYTQDGRTMDLTAPGESGWAACDSGAPGCTNFRGGHSDFQLFGGTSESAPLTAGAAALVISAYRSTHSGANPSPALVKTLLTSTATDLGLPTFEQGAGLLNARAAVEAALTYPGASVAAPDGVSSNVTVTPSQVDLAGAPGTSKQAKVTVTNVGTHNLTVAAAGRDFRTTGVTSLGTALLQSGPTFPYPTNGAAWVYKKVTFTVPASTARTAVQMAWAGGASKVVRLSMFDPSGTYVANSRPQGGSTSANYANVDVRQPTAGTWTAVIYTPSGITGFNGTVGLEFTSQVATPVGSVANPALTLAPGQSKTIKSTFPIPAAGGDTSYALTVASSDGHQTAVPVVVRSIVPVVGGTGRFAGTITGGNARAGAAAQTLTYGFDVPAGLTDLGVDLQLDDDAGYVLEGVLVDPNDQEQAVDSNIYTVGSTNFEGLGLHMSAVTPKAGRWRVIILVMNPVPGDAFTEGFTGQIAFNTGQVSADDLPNSAGTVIPAGSTVTAHVTVHNTGSEPINVQVDPRTQKVRTTQLTSPYGPQTFQLPAHSAPTFLVPPGTTRLTATAVSDVPAIVDLLDGAQGIDVVGDLAAAQGGSTVSVASVHNNPSLTTGVWYTDVNEVGPVGPSGAPTANSTVSLSASTLGFDPTVTSSTGDFWGVVTNPSADLGTPVSIAAGDTQTITIQIAPTAAPGTVVKGYLYVYTPPSFVNPSFATTGDELAKLPYSYTVGS